MNISTLLLSCALASYAAGFACYVFEFFGREPKKASFAGRLIETGFFLHTLQIFVYAFSAPEKNAPHLYLPVGSLAASSGFFAWSLAFVYFILVRRYRTEGFGLVLSPILAVFLIPALAAAPVPLEPANLSYWDNHYFLLHILSAFFAYAAFALSFAAGLLYLAQDRALKLKTGAGFYHRLPPLEELERFVFRTLFWGAALLALAIVSGGFWTKSVFGHFFLKEPKSYAAAATWGVYGWIVWVYAASVLKGRRFVLLSVWAFALVLFTFIGASMIKAGLHAGI